MPTRKIISVAFLAGLMLSGPWPAAAAETGRAGNWRFELPRRERPRRIVRELLGGNRVRELNLTRYEMELQGLDFTPELSSRRAALEEIEDILMSSFLRVSRERLERELLLKERYDAWRARLRGESAGGPAAGRRKGPSLRVSPRTYVTERDALVGAKLRLRGLGSRRWSRAGLGITHELSGNDLRLELSLLERDWSASVVFHTERREHGRSGELRIGVTF